VHLKFRTSEVLSNLFYIGAGDFGSRILSFGAFIYIARVLGPDKLGLIGFGAAAVALAVPFVDYGLGFVGTREVSRNPASLKFYIKTILFDRFLLGSVALGCLVVAAEFFFEDPEKTRILLLYGLTLAPAILSLTWAYQGIGQTGWFLVEKNVQAILYCAGVFLFVHRPGDFERIPEAYTVSALLPAVAILIYYLQKHRTSTGTLDVTKGLGLLKSSFKLFVPTLLSQVSLSIGLLLVVYFSSLQEAGYFSAASKIILLSAAIPNLLWSSFYPILSRTGMKDTAQVRSSATTLYKYTVLIGVLPLFFGLMFSRELVNLLFGSSYDQAVVPFQLFSAVASIQFLSIVFTRILPAFGMESAFSRIVTGGVIIQVVTSLLLIPRFGAAGAAVSYVLSEGIVAVVAMLIIRRLVVVDLLRQPIVSLATLVLCYLVVMGIRMLTDLPILVCLIAIALLYFLVLVVTSVVSLGDFVPVESSVT
jgi:O-antigen/teichoic acid export membrane protein